MQIHEQRSSHILSKRNGDENTIIWFSYQRLREELSQIKFQIKKVFGPIIS